MPDLLPYVELLGTLLGFAALITVIINVLKRYGVIQDGQAGLVSLGLNFALLGFVIVGKYFGLDLTQADDIAGAIASLVTVILGLLLPPLVSLGVHRLARKRIPLVGFSHSA